MENFYLELFISRNSESIKSTLNKNILSKIDGTLYKLGLLMDSYRFLEEKLDYGEKKHLIDSLQFIGRGLELLNSAMLITIKNHFPSQMYLFRSSLNSFWFSYLSITNSNFKEKYNNNGFLSGEEIKGKEFTKIITKGIDKDDSGLIKEFNNILHLGLENNYLYVKNTPYTFEFSPYQKTNKDLNDCILSSLIHINGMIEFARLIIDTIYIKKDLNLLYKGFNKKNMSSKNFKDYEKMLEYIEKQTTIKINYKSPTKSEK
ncbi:MAG: hypothetical protein N4A38_01685 [Candidatus Gracilibacteria bacterium]|nr:hypothetical protein [Candidatus Gracilibacteria bacterium]